MKYYMNGLDKSVMELHGIIKTAEESIVRPRNSSSTTLILAIREGGFKRKRPSSPNVKGKSKSKFSSPNSKPMKEFSDIPPMTKPKEPICYYCQEDFHWKCSFPKYLADLKKNKAKGDGTSSMFTFELHSTSTYNN